MSTHQMESHTVAPVTPAPAQAPVPYGDPAGLGLAAFALTTFVLSVVNAGWIHADLTATVFSLALFYGGIGQIIAGVWEFANRNTFGAVAFSSYGAFWLSFWYLNVATKLGRTPPRASECSCSRGASSRST